MAVAVNASTHTRANSVLRLYIQTISQPLPLPFNPTPLTVHTNDISQIFHHNQFPLSGSESEYDNTTFPLWR